jgi:hypothetical protein
MDMTQQEQKQILKQAIREIEEERGKNGKNHNSNSEKNKVVSRSFWNQILATVIAGIILTAGVSYGAIRLGMANLEYRMKEVETKTEENCIRLDDHEDHIMYFRELHELPNDPVVTRNGQVFQLKLDTNRRR